MKCLHETVFDLLRESIVYPCTSIPAAVLSGARDFALSIMITAVSHVAIP